MRALLAANLTKEPSAIGMRMIVNIVIMITMFSSLSYCQTITATVRISSYPGVTGSFNNVKMYYDASNERIRFDYNLQGNGRPIEIIDYADDVRYLRCTSCNAESYTGKMPIFHRISNDINNVKSASLSWTQECGSTAYQRIGTGEEITNILFDSNNRVCWARASNGKTYQFYNVTQSTTNSLDSMFDISTWRCPQKQCTKKIDIMLVFDKSGSITTSEWEVVKKFGVDFVNSFTISEDSVKIGLVTFDDTVQLNCGLSNSKSSIINCINNAVRRGGWTCIGCGLRLARQALDQGGRGVDSVIVLMSDGENNRPICSTQFCNGNVNAFHNAVNFAKRSPSPLIVSVGVGNVIEEEMHTAASGSMGVYNGVQTYFPTPDFNGLNSLLNGLISSTCTDLPGTPCGPTCKGFCGCDAQCLCPDDCTNSDPCQVGKCVTGSAGNGCFWDRKQCDDKNACTSDSCVANQGCEFKDVDCAPRKCYVPSCDRTSGCIYSRLQCTGDGDPCKEWYCDEFDGSCKWREKDCDACLANGLDRVVCSTGKSKCEEWDCIQVGRNASCEKIRDRDCDDKNECTIDSCNPQTGNCTNVPIICDDGNACTTDRCDPNIPGGCVFEPIDVATVCDDRSVCTIDTCQPNVVGGCVHTPITCDDGNFCTDNRCDSIGGCVYRPTDCSQHPALSSKIGNCYLALCNEGNNTLPNEIVRPDHLGCFLGQIPGTKVDNCGVCGGDGSTCFLGIGSAAAAGIGVGALAMIIGSAAAFIIFSGIAGKKGYDHFVKSKNQLHGAQNNSLYQDSGRSGNNPFYEA